jgi:multidrug efflux system outer membrane protein
MHRSSNIPKRSRNLPVWKTIAIAFTLMVPTGCHIPELRSAQSNSPLPEGFPSANPDSTVGTAGKGLTATLTIEQYYHDSKLTQLIQDALGGNLELRMIDEEIQIASNEVLARRGAYLPFVGVRGGAGLDKPSRYTREGAVDEQLEIAPGRDFPNPTPDYLGVFNIFWRIDIWREFRNARDAANLRYEAALERRSDFVTRLVADVAETYYELMALDRRLENLNSTIELQEKSLDIAKARKDAGRGNELAVQRFLAEVQKNRSEKLIVAQDIVEAQNRMNFLVGRYPQPIERSVVNFFDVDFSALNVGLPSELLQNRPDIRQAERELSAAGLDILVAKARFYPSLDITANVGYRAFNPRYLVKPDALVYNVAGDLVAPLINKKAIQADYLSANARQLQAIYNYQRVVLNAYLEVVNRVSMVDQYRKSLQLKKQQLDSLESSVDVATKLFQNARAEYVEVLLAQRDMMDARMIYIDTKKQQLSAMIKAFQALGGGSYLNSSGRPSAPLMR